jgi:transposase, IS30 family
LGYKQITMDEREVIMIRFREGVDMTTIAEELGRHISTISRELSRNDFGRGYSAHRSNQRAIVKLKRPRHAKKMTYEPLRKYVDQHLRECWSPEQISGRLKKDQTDSRMHVSHETIYMFILDAADQGVSYEAYLRQGHRRHAYAWRGNKRFKRIRNYKKIEERPPVVAERSRVGDWESDTVRGPNYKPAGIATHVERKTRYLVAVKLENRSAAAYNQATIEAFKKQPQLPRFTMTVDNGMEFSQFKQMEDSLNIGIYFATPYHSWERGQNENTNGLLRQYFPKRCDLGGVHPAEIAEATNQLNNRPRKCLDYQTPAEAMGVELIALGY